MAKQKGIFKIKGTLDDTTFFKGKDGYIAKVKGEVEKDRIMTDPLFARTRENMSEFGRAGKAAKLLRDAIGKTMGNNKDKRLTSRLTKLMMKVVISDPTNAKGERNVTDGDASLLNNFDFNVDAPLSVVFKPDFTSAVNRQTGAMTIDIPAFVPADNVPGPQGSTHFKIISAGLEIDFANDVHLVSQFESEVLPINNVATAAIPIAHSVTANSTNPLFSLLGIKFYQLVNGIAYPLLNSAFSAFGVVDVDVV